MITGIISAAVWVLTILGYVIFNLYRKNVKLEEMVQERDKVLVSLSSMIEESGKQLEEVDRLGAFKSDDEIGFFFNTVKNIQQTLNLYKV